MDWNIIGKVQYKLEDTGKPSQIFSFITWMTLFCYFNLLMNSSDQTLSQATWKISILEQLKILEECWSLYTDWKD